MSQQQILVEHDPSGFATVKLARKPVNSLNTAFIQEITSTIESLENDPACKGIILTSAIPNIFSAGLDITEMYNTTRERHHTFWTSLQVMFMKLYGTRLITIAAISGACPAAGCLIAMACDYRIMANGGNKYRIGLNETQLGIIAPCWFADLMVATIGQRHTERLLQLGALITAEEALKVGLVDEVADTQDELAAKAISQMKKWMAIPASARVETKLLLRKPAIDKLKQNAEQDAKFVYEFVADAKVQAMLGRVLQQLSAGTRQKQQKQQQQQQQHKQSKM